MFDSLQPKAEFPARPILLLVPASYTAGSIRIYTRKLYQAGMHHCPITTVKDTIDLFGLNKLISELKPRLVVCASYRFLQFFARGLTITDYTKLVDTVPVSKLYKFSTFSCMGSTYWYSSSMKRTFLLEDLHKIPEREEAGMIPVFIAHENAVITHKSPKHDFMIDRMFQKIKPFMHGDYPYQAVKQYPKFSWIRCDTRRALLAFESYAMQADLIAMDVETNGKFITCSGYTCLNFTNDEPCGFTMKTFVVPFYKPVEVESPTHKGYKGGSAFLHTSDEELAWHIIRKVHLNDSIKVMQNGASYDASYFVKYACPLKNFLLDTMHMHHALYCELPKRLDTMSAMYVLLGAAWKHETKTQREESTDVKEGTLPKSTDDWIRYLTYNAKDCFYTMLVALELVKELQEPARAYAIPQYWQQLATQLGPLLLMNMQGFWMDKEFNDVVIRQWEVDCMSNYSKFRYLTGGVQFNPASPAQVQEFMYDIMNLPELDRKGRTTDKKDLAVIQYLDPVADRVLEPMLKYKEAKNNLSKYSRIYSQWPYGKFVYKVSTGATTTDRLASAGSNFWVGTNAQNMPYTFRYPLSAGHGRLLVKIDYSQSDMYFSAFCLEDRKMMDVVLSPDDSHCIHAAQFFSRPYSEIYEAHQRHEAWVSDNQIGMRSLTKRVVYGANYGMGGYTLLFTMGLEAVKATALIIGLPCATTDEAIVVCNHMLAIYNVEIYPEQRARLASIYQELDTQTERHITGAFGTVRRVFGKATRAAVKREIASYYGQNGTAIMIVKAMLRIYNSKRARELDIRILLQVHDELVFSIPAEHIHEATALCVELMTKPITVNGRTFVVPAEPEIGTGYGKRLLDYDKVANLPWPDVFRAAEDKSQDVLAQLKAKLKESTLDLLVDQDYFSKMITDQRQ